MSGAVESPQHAEETEASNGAILPGFDEDEEMDPDEMLSDEDAPDLQDEIAKTLTSLRVRGSCTGMALYLQIYPCLCGQAAGLVCIYAILKRE